MKKTKAQLVAELRDCRRKIFDFEAGDAAMEGEGRKRENPIEETDLGISDSLFVVLDTNGIVTQVNPTASRILGWREGELVGLNWFESALPVSEREEVRVIFESLMNGVDVGTDFFDNHVLTKTGESRLISWHNAVLKDPDGLTIGTVSSGLDVTACSKQKREEVESQRSLRVSINSHRMADQALGDSDVMLGAIIENSSNLYFSHTPNYRLTYLSPRCLEFLECRPEEALVSWHSFVSDNPANRIGQLRKDQAIRTGVGQPPYELEIQGVFGQKIWTEVRETPVVRNGRITAIVGSLTDISLRRSAQFELTKREARLENIFRSAPVPMAVLDTEGRLLIANTALADFLGHKISGLLGASFESFSHPDDREEGLRLFGDLISGDRERYSRLKRYFRKDGTIVWDRLHVACVRNEKGGFSEIIAIWIDETARHLAEQRIRRYEVITNASSDLMIMIDRDYRYLVANEAYCSYYGLENREMLGRTISEIVGERNFEGLVKPSIDLAMSGEEVRFEAEFTYPAMGDRFVSVRYNPVRDPENRVTAVVASIRDVTERKELHNRLMRADRMQALGTLAGGISHDFNNLLAPILGYAELILDQVGEESTVAPDLREIQKAGERAKLLVDKILAFSRRSDVQVDAVDLNDVADAVLGLLRSATPSSVTIRKTVDTAARVFGNASELEQVLMNLCTNAIQAMEEGGGVLEIKIDDLVLERMGTQHDIQGLFPGDYVRVTVSDTGVGIAPGTIGSIFEPYFTTKSRGSGTGLGLATVQGIIERYGGRISVDSKLGIGTVFRFNLPVCLDKQNEPSEEVDELPSGTERVLVVDDELPVATVMSLQLRQLGYAVETVMEPHLALERIEADPFAFDLVVTDLTMPGLRGDQLAAEIQRINPKIPVILCSGYASALSEESFRNLGIKAFLQKPIRTKTIATAVRSVLNQIPQTQ